MKDIQTQTFNFGQKLQKEHGFRLITAPSKIHQQGEDLTNFVHTVTYQTTRFVGKEIPSFKNSKQVVYIDCVVSVPLASVGNIGVTFTVQFESYNGTTKVDTFFNTHGDFSEIEIGDVVRRLVEIAHVYSKDS